MSLGFESALSALNTARLALDTIGHNIANANTKGYSRQRVILTENTPQLAGPGLAVGTGVRVASVDQITDEYLNGRLRDQTQQQGFFTAQRDVFSDLQSAFGEPSDTGLNHALGSYFTRLQNLKSAPSDIIARRGAIESASSLAGTLRSVSGAVKGLRKNITDSLGSEAGKANQALDSIVDLNRSIVASGFAGQLPPDVRDQQAQLLSDLSQYVDVQTQQISTGQIVVSSGGQTLVTATEVNHIQVVKPGATNDTTRLRIEGSGTDFTPHSGSLRGLLDVDPTLAQENLTALDALARNLIAATNHAQATGTPAAGGYTDLTAANGITDTNGNGSVLDEVIGQAGLPFPIQDGTLTVTVANDTTGATSQRRIPINSSTTTIGDVRDALNTVPGLTAFVDVQGHLRVKSDPGFKFDFSGRLNPHPDAAGTFGGVKPTLVGASSFPVPITPGDSFNITIDGGPVQTLTFLSGQFADPLHATPAEVAAVFNGQITGATASVVNGRLVVQSASSGPGTSLQVTDGTGAPAAVLGLSPTVATGQQVAVDFHVTGAYTGSGDGAFTVRPLSDGVIGQTPGLRVEVRSSGGEVVGILDVGAGYVAGTPLDLPDGVKLGLGAGTVSASTGQFAQIDAVADGDSAGVLTAIGFNQFFTGTDASTIAVSQRLKDDPTLLATGRGAGASDNRNLTQFLNAQTTAFANLDGQTIQERYDSLVTKAGFAAQRADNTVQTQGQLVQQLENRRQSISGVNVDEELLSLDTFQRSYQVAARLTQTLSTVYDSLLSLGR